MGSTSWAITTIEAFFCSINLVTVFVPERMVLGFLDGGTSLPLALASAAAFRRAFLAISDSGRYFSRSLNSCTAVCLSAVWVNWLTGGGTFRRFCSTDLCRWMRIYLGHLTNLAKSLLGWTFWPAIWGYVTQWLFWWPPTRFSTIISTLTDAKVLGALLKEWIGDLLGFHFLHCEGRRRDFLSHALLLVFASWAAFGSSLKYTNR